MSTTFATTVKVGSCGTLTTLTRSPIEIPFSSAKDRVNAISSLARGQCPATTFSVPPEALPATRLWKITAVDRTQQCPSGRVSVNDKITGVESRELAPQTVNGKLLPAARSPTRGQASMPHHLI